MFVFKTTSGKYFRSCEPDVSNIRNATFFSTKQECMDAVNWDLCGKAVEVKLSVQVLYQVCCGNFYYTGVDDNFSPKQEDGRWFTDEKVFVQLRQKYSMLLLCKAE
jgi:hypothetical protein